MCSLSRLRSVMFPVCAGEAGNPCMNPSVNPSVVHPTSRLYVCRRNLGRHSTRR